MSANKFRFYQPVQVRYADTDAQGHVFFGNYFTYFDEALGGYFRAIGCSWPKLAESGIDMLYVDAHCEYKGSAHYEDILHVHAQIARIGNTSLTLECAIYPRDVDQLIASGHITSVVVDLKNRQPMRVPDMIRQAVAAYEGLEPEGDNR